MSAAKDKDKYRLKQNVLKVSREKKDIIKALEEWELVDHKTNDDPTKKFQCICNSHPWKDQSTYYNPFTKMPIWVGSGCAEKFKKHAKPGMKNGAAQGMFKDILAKMTADEKLEYKDIANILAYCRGVIDGLVAHVEQKLQEGIPLALEQLIECLTGIYKRQEELYLPWEHIKALVQKLEGRLAELSRERAAEAARLQKEAEDAAQREAERLQKEAEERERKKAEAAARKAAEEAARAARIQREAEQAAAREAAWKAAQEKRKAEEAERRRQAEEAQKEAAERRARAAAAAEEFRRSRLPVLQTKAEEAHESMIQDIINRQQSKKK